MKTTPDRDRASAERRARHVERLLEQDHDALRRAIERAAALRAFATAFAELGESIRLVSSITRSIGEIA